MSHDPSSTSDILPFDFNYKDQIVSDDPDLLEPSEFLSYAMLCPVMAVDTETNAEDIRDGRGFAIGISCAVNYDGRYLKAYFPVAHDRDNISNEIKELLFNVIASRAAIIFHNAKFDLVSLSTAGYTHGFRKWYCTLMMAHFLNENVPKGLQWLANNALKEPGKKKPRIWTVMHTLHGWSPAFPPEIMAIYACEDAVLTLKLFEYLYPRFVKSGFDGSPMPELRKALP